MVLVHFKLAGKPGSVFQVSWKRSDTHSSVERLKVALRVGTTGSSCFFFFFFFSLVLFLFFFVFPYF